MIRSVTRATFQQRTKRPHFGEKGKTGILIDPSLWPLEHRGVITDTNYVWNQRRPSVWVDKRDLPKLIQVVGIENLRGDGEFEKMKAKSKAAKQKKRKTPPRPQPAEAISEPAKASEKDGGGA